MRKLRLVVATLFALVVTVSLAACGGGSQEVRFQGREARDASEMMTFAEEGRKLAESRRSQMTDQYLDEGETISATQVDFVQANNLYRSGTYDEAADGYRSIIETAPSHMGANVNLVLALLQLGEVEEALSQAFACTFLYSTEPGVILNLQVAAVANGFSSTDALSTMTEALEEAGYLNPLEYMDGSSVEQECTYNMLWDDIDLQLYDVAQGEASENDHSYYDLTVRLRELEAQDDERVEAGLTEAEDEDLDALRAYLEAVGDQLGIGLS